MEAVSRLEGRHRRHGAGAVLAIHLAGVVAQGFQPGLNAFHVIPLITLAQGAGRNGSVRIRRRGGGCRRRGHVADLPCQHLFHPLQGLLTGFAVCTQALSPLKGRYCLLGARTVATVCLAGTEAQLIQSLLQ